jgi:hypothetical protein
MESRTNPAPEGHLPIARRFSAGKSRRKTAGVELDSLDQEKLRARMIQQELHGVDLVHRELSVVGSCLTVIQHIPERSEGKRMEPTIGLEPMTCRLRIGCSTN